MVYERTQLSRSMRVPSYMDDEIKLGFQSELLILDGLSPNQVQMIKVPNIRKTKGFIEEGIKNYWSEQVQKNAENMKSKGLNIEVSYVNERPNAIYEILPDGEKVLRMHDGDRARFEGAEFDTDSKKARIFWSEDNYSRHFFLRDSPLPKTYQAQLFGTNGAIICNYEGDESVIIGERDPLRTDQGKMLLFVPAGFIDTKYIDEEVHIEGLYEAFERKFFDELDIPGRRSSESPFKAIVREGGEELKNISIKEEDIKLISIIYNYSKNFDTSAIMAVQSGLDYKDISLKGGEHLSKFPVSLKYQSLVDFLYELSQNPEANSGHLRGGIASLIGYKHGEEAYKEALEEVIIKLYKENSL